MYKSGAPHQPQAQHLEFKVCKSSDFEIRGAQFSQRLHPRSSWVARVLIEGFKSSDFKISGTRGVSVRCQDTAAPCVCASGWPAGLWHQLQGPRLMCGFTTRRHHLVSCRVSNSASPPNAASGDNSTRDPIRRHTMWPHNSASPKTMRLQEFGFGVRSFATLPQAPAAYDA